MFSEKIYSPSRTYQLSKIYDQIENDILLITASEDEAILASKQINYFYKSQISYFFPAWDILAYDRISPKSENLSIRTKFLSKFCSDQKHKIVTVAASNFLQKLPAREEFLNNQCVLKNGDQVSVSNLTKLLSGYGYLRCSEATYIGEFSVTGEIVDIIMSAEDAFRINIAWDKIETIKIIDPDSKLSKAKINELALFPSTEFYLSLKNRNRFKQSFLKEFGVNHIDQPIYESTCSGRHYPAVENLLPLLFDELEPLTSYLHKPKIVIDQITKNSLEVNLEDIEDLYETRISTSKSLKAFDPILAPQRLYLNNKEINSFALDRQLKLEDVATIEQTENVPNFFHQSKQSQLEVIKVLDDFLGKYPNHNITFCCSSISSAERIKNILEHNGSRLTTDVKDLTEAEIGQILYYGNRKNHKVEILLLPMRYGFVSQNNIYVSQFELFGEKVALRKKNQNRKLKNILNELDTFAEGALVVHEEHGIAQFLGVERIQVGKVAYDCVKLLYADDDKIYIPVENIDTIKKYGNDSGNLDKLGGVSWQRRKAKIKDRIGELAGKLIKIAAKRKVENAEPYQISEDYKKFVKKFSYVETEDQLRAVEDIEKDLTSGNLMDRLVCGDVGFGKTEVAMRAAYLAVANGNQVAVIVPTTILARQHYISFLSRFHGSGFTIKHISRLVKPSEISKTKAGIRDGDVDIVIGTHALLAKDISFDNLGMVILDEEQHFGVSQKEKLKEMQTNINILALSATPIPRTLQMGLLGIRDLSLIATPPVDRLSIRTSIIQSDEVIIRDALMREYLRGGKSYFVAPRISDLEDLAKRLSKITPELKFRIAHGQMAASEIEDIMDEFDQGKFDILLSTTIIESGIDVPSANTIIIYRADMLGLSQLYQLRGRIGRSKARGYAYLIIDKKNLSKHSQKRLEIMQNVDSLGAGFSVASYDMDIRGFGNLVGDEQSGTIKEVGLELYQEMLTEEIQKLKGEDKVENHMSIDINLGISFSLPETYISDSQLRLKLYKRIGALEIEEIENFEDELVDRFGSIPIEVKNLLSVVEVKQICRELRVVKLDVGPSGTIMKFHKNYDASQVVMSLISKFPRSCKIKPDGGFVFLQQTSTENVVSETKKLLLMIKEQELTAADHPCH